MRDITNEQIIRRIRVENPWWEKPHTVSPLYEEWTPRPYIELLYPLVKNRQVRRAVVLMGPRRVGKTVIIHHVIQKLLKSRVKAKRVAYITIDHPIYNGLGLEQILDLIIEATGIDYYKEECFVFFDEIQYLKNWEVHLKALVDSFPSLKCIASGSAAAALKLKSAESGAGRFTDFLLPPLTFYEYLTLLHKDHLIVETETDRFYDCPDIDELNKEFINYLNFGGYPEAIFSIEIQSDPSRFIKSDIIDKVLLRDLPSIYGISDIQELNHLFCSLAYNTAGEVSLEGLSKRSGVAKNTLKKYIEYLEAAFLIKVVHRIDRNAKRFQRANYFKVYLTNPSIRSGLYSTITIDSNEIGDMVETGIFSQWLHSGEMDLCYARWNDGKDKHSEIDFVRMSKGKINYLLESKWSDSFGKREKDLNHIISFCHNHNVNRTYITTRSTKKSTTLQNIKFDFVPVSLYCYTEGRTAIENKLFANEIIKIMS